MGPVLAHLFFAAACCSAVSLATQALQGVPGLAIAIAGGVIVHAFAGRLLAAALSEDVATIGHMQSHLFSGIGWVSRLSFSLIVPLTYTSQASQ